MGEYIENDPRPPHPTSPDPRRRYCVEHQEPYEDHGGGPSPYSECPSCYRRACANPTPISAFNAFLEATSPQINVTMEEMVRNAYAPWRRP